MTVPAERVLDETLEYWSNSGPENNIAVILMASELLERRRMEYICPQCGLRHSGVSANPNETPDIPF